MNTVDRIYATFNKEKTSQRISNEEEGKLNQNLQYQNKEMKVIKRKLTQRKGSGDSNDVVPKLNPQGSIGTLKNKKESIALVNENMNPASPMTHREETVLDFTDN